MIELLLYIVLLQTPLKEFHISGAAQGTTYHITYYARDSVVTQAQTDSILRALDSSLSIYKPYSLISQFNKADSCVLMDEHLSRVVRRSLEIYRASKGQSDITVYPLVEAWGFGPTPAGGIPDSIAIRRILGCVGGRNLYIRGNKLFKRRPCIKIDVNGIAQGYSTDVVAGFLEKKGIRNYLVEIGGEIRVNGRKPANDPLLVGIEAPAASAGDEPVIRKIVALPSGAITTSGNYRKYYMSGNKKISHIMNPITGYPIQNEMISATVYAHDAMTADGYDNVFMSMGVKASFEFLSRHKEMEAYFIYQRPDGSTADTATAGFNRFFAKKAPNTLE